MLRFDFLAEENRYLLGRYEIDIQREHYYEENSHFISELFEEDKAHLLLLPSIPFDTSLYKKAVMDKYGRFPFDAGKHRCSASPTFCEFFVNLMITFADVIVMGKDMHEVVCHKRLYGEEHERIEDKLAPISCLYFTQVPFPT